jgi:hypothetical protein
LDISNLGVLGVYEERLDEISTDPGSFSISDVGKWPKMALARPKKFELSGVQKWPFPRSDTFGNTTDRLEIERRS